MNNIEFLENVMGLNLTFYQKELLNMLDQERSKQIIFLKGRKNGISLVLQTLHAFLKEVKQNQ